MEGLTGRGGGSDSPDVEAVRACVDLMEAASGTVRLYGHDHPETARAIDDAVHRIDELTNWIGPVVLQTSPSGFRWRGKSVSDERDDRVGLGRRTHMEGISSLGISPGIDADELARLLDILRTNLSLPTFEEETLESLLWQAELGFVTFRAITELMQAEAESGREADEESLRAMARGMVELQDGDIEEGRQFAAALSPDDVRGGDIVDQWQLNESMDLDNVSDDEWAERFATEAGDDAAAVAEIREVVRFERSSQLLSRLVMILLKSACADRAEVPRPKADELIGSAMRQVYAIGDPVGLLEVIEHSHALSLQIRAQRPDLDGWVRDLLRRVYSPIRAARMLSDLDPNDVAEREVIDRFLRILPDQAIFALFDSVAREEDPGAHAPLLRYVCTSLSERIGGWLGNAARMPTEQALPLVAALQLADPPELRGVRAEFLRHVSASVRESTLAWYEADLPAGDAPTVAACLVDRNAVVRAAATRCLAAHRPPSAVQLIAKTLRGDGFPSLDQDRKSDLCAAYGRVAGPSAITLLSEMLQTRIPLLNNDEAASTVYAAAMGLAAMGTANAVLVLEKGVRAISGHRRNACQVALAMMERQGTESVDNG